MLDPVPLSYRAGLNTTFSYSVSELSRFMSLRRSILLNQFTLRARFRRNIETRATKHGIKLANPVTERPLSRNHSDE